MSEGMRPGTGVDKERVLAMAALPDLCATAGLELRRSGGGWWAPCPFHAERSASFKVEDRGTGKGWRFKCFGCGKGGNAIDFWMEIRGLSFVEAVGDLAVIYGLAGWAEAEARKKEMTFKKVTGNGKGRRVRDEEEERRHLMLPPLRRLSGDTMRELAVLRGISIEGVRAACEAGVIWGNVFGVSERYWGGSRSKLVWGERMEHEEGMGRLRVGPVRCWVCCEGATWDGRPGTAGLRHGAAVRRMDGEEWRRFDGRGFKSWAVGSKAVPVGVFSMGDRPYVMLVEGEGDLLAGYHFLATRPQPRAGAELLTAEGTVERHTVENTAVVCVMGAASGVPEEVWPLFKGRRVRLFPDFDEERETGAKRVRKRAGWEWAGRLQSALREAGAEVDCFWFGTGEGDETTEGTVGEEVKKGLPGLRRADGGRVKDLGDAARGDEECLRVMEEECFGRLWRKRVAVGGRGCAGVGVGLGEGVTGALTRYAWVRGAE